MKAYDRETDMWNKIFEEYEPVDLRGINLSVEPMFDEALMEFSDRTNNVLDFGCGTGDISFQCLQYHPEHHITGIDRAARGIAFAKETAQISDYQNVRFFFGGDELLEQFQRGGFDGIIISNVLDVMPKEVSKETVHRLDRLLADGGYWFVKMNPYYSKEELASFGYEKKGDNLYEEEGVLHLRQSTTDYWKKQFSKLGKIKTYLEFQYPWQEGLNRLFVIEKKENQEENC